VCEKEVRTDLEGVGSADIHISKVEV